MARFLQHQAALKFAGYRNTMLLSKAFSLRCSRCRGDSPASGPSCSVRSPKHFAMLSICLKACLRSMAADEQVRC